MADYNWEEIFKKKTEKELVDIYIGKSFLDFEAEIYAGLELRNRKYDFSKIEQFHIAKEEKLKKEISDFQNLDFKSSGFLKKQISYFIGIILVLIILITDDFNSNFRLYKALIYLVIFVVSILTSKWSYRRFVRKKEESIKSRIDLLNKMNMSKINADTVNWNKQ
jgi:amino acid permease